METTIKTIVTIGGGITSFLWGGWSQMLATLLVFVTIDYISGVISAAKEGKLSSRTGMYGITRKVMIFAMVAAAHLLDQALGDTLVQINESLGYSGHLLGDMTTSYYLANEGISLIENFGRMGVPIPPVFKKAVEVFGEKTNEADTETNKNDQG